MTDGNGNSYLTPSVEDSRSYSYAPTARGTNSTTISFTPSNGFAAGTAPTVTITLSGTGVGPVFASSVAPGSTIDFGTLLLSQTGTQALNLSNDSPDPDGLGDLTALTLKSFSITGDDPGFFTVTNFVAGTKLADGGPGLALDIGFVGSTVKDTYSATLTFLTDEGQALGADGSMFSYSLQAVAVPEPKAWLLFAAGLACVGMVAMRRRRESLRLKS